MILYCFLVKWFDTMPHIWAPSECPTQTISFAFVPMNVRNEYNWAVHWATSFVLDIEDR